MPSCHCNHPAGQTATDPTADDLPSRQRRLWHISGVSHATVVAYLALFMAMSGTAVAATGGNFILGRSNSASTQTTLTNSASTALSLNSPTGVAPLKVNRTTKITNLNADLLDGRNSTDFLRLGTTNTRTTRTTLTNTEGIPLRLTPKAGSAPLTVDSQVKVTNLNADLLDGKNSTSFVSKAAHDALAARVTELETLLASMSLTTVDSQPTVRFTGVNVQIVNGQGTTNTANGRGNLIIGYNQQRRVAATRTGSHYLITGDRHQWTTYGGIVTGYTNTATGDFATVTGGQFNTASGTAASASGGFQNTASGEESSVSGGSYNTAGSARSSVSGGSNNLASYTNASVSGGTGNQATGANSSVSGGGGNTASATGSSILGGSTKTVSTIFACHPSCA